MLFYSIDSIRFASIKRMHDEVGRKQTEDYQKRLQKLKEEEVSFVVKLKFIYNYNKPLMRK